MAPKLRHARARSQSTSSASRKSRPSSPKKKTPSKKRQSKSPKKTPSAKSNKTPTTAKSRSRSTSRGRKVNTAPAAPRSRSRSRTASASRKPAAASKPTPRLVSTTVSSGGGQQQRPSSSLAQYYAHEARLRPRGPSGSSISSYSSSSSGRSPRSTASSTKSTISNISNAVFNNRVAQKLRRVLSCGGSGGKRCWTKTKKHVKSHWKAYFFVIMTILSAYFAYKFSKEILSQLKQISNTITEYAEAKRKIFGEYAEELARAIEEAKQNYLSGEPSQPQETIKPFDHLEKPHDVPHHQTTPPTVERTIPHVNDKSKHTIEDAP